MTFQNRISFSLQVVSNQKVPWRPADPCLLLWSSLANHLRSPHRKQPLPWVWFLVAAEHFCSQLSSRHQERGCKSPPFHHNITLPCSGHCISAAVGVWYSLLVHDLTIYLFSNSTSSSWFDWMWWEEMQLMGICHVDTGIGHTQTFTGWLPVALPQPWYHPRHLSSNLIRLFGQKVCINKCPTPMAALFVNPLSLLKVLPFLPCLLGVTSVPFISQYSPSTRGEDNPPEPVVLYSLR